MVCGAVLVSWECRHVWRFLRKYYTHRASGVGASASHPPLGREGDFRVVRLSLKGKESLSSSAPLLVSHHDVEVPGHCAVAHHDGQGQTKLHLLYASRSVR